MANRLAAIPRTERALLRSALRHANKVSGLLNDLSAEVFRVAGDECDKRKWSRLHTLLRSRFGRNSGLHLFIAADNLGLLKDEPYEGDER